MVDSIGLIHEQNVSTTVLRKKVDKMMNYSYNSHASKKEDEQSTRLQNQDCLSLAYARSGGTITGTGFLFHSLSMLLSYSCLLPIIATALLLLYPIATIKFLPRPILPKPPFSR